MLKTLYSSLTLSFPFIYNRLMDRKNGHRIEKHQILLYSKLSLSKKFLGEKTTKTWDQKQKLNKNERVTKTNS